MYEEIEYGFINKNKLALIMHWIKWFIWESKEHIGFTFLSVDHPLFVNLLSQYIHSDRIKSLFTYSFSRMKNTVLLKNVNLLHY